MANINVNNGRGRTRKGRPNKMNLRVDFTPMVDMNMLLITFFMFCTTLSIPKVMDIVVPTKDGGPTQTAESKSLTLVLDEGDKIYYYFGKPDYNNYASLKTTHFGSDGLRNVLLERNNDQFLKARALKKQLTNKEITEDEFKAKMTEVRKSKDGITVLVKPTDKASYKNLVDVLDEMQVCNVSKYAIMDVGEADNFLLENYRTKGTLTAQIR